MRTIRIRTQRLYEVYATLIHQNDEKEDIQVLVDSDSSREAEQFVILYFTTTLGYKYCEVSHSLAVKDYEYPKK